MKTKPGLYCLIVIILLMLGVLITSAGFRQIEAKLLPMVVAGVVLFLSVIELVREAKGNKGSPSQKESAAGADEASKGLLGRYLYEGAWIIGFFLGIYLVGFLAAMALFILAYLKLHGRRWLISIIMAVTVTLFSYATFYLLGVDSYPGLLFR